ncbi:MAG: ankyrin repeat domain-containing protein [Chlamydiales bacterium]
MHTTTTPLFTKTDWANLFSRELYEKYVKKDSSLSEKDKELIKDHSLKYLIALNQSDGSILNYIQKLKTNNSAQINSHFPTHQITALHIAIMRNRMTIVNKLIASGAIIDAQDEYGWTALHHAAIVSNDLVAFILSKNPMEFKTNNKGGTYQDLMSLQSGQVQNVALPAIDVASSSNMEYASMLTVEQIPAAPSSIYYQPIDKPKEQVSREVLSARLNITYIDECKWPDTMLYTLWNSAHSSRGDSLSQIQIRELYPLLKIVPPKIILKEVLIPSSGSVSMEVLADKQLKPFSLIGEYTGKIKKIPHTQEGEGTYSFVLERKEDHTLSVDAEIAGNWARYMNDGFPNVISFDLFNTAGQTCRKVFFVADPAGISQDTPLHIDYSYGYFTLKWQKPYIITEKQRLQEFFKCFEHHCQKLDQLEKEMKGHIPYLKKIEYQSLAARLLYPFTTPWALAYLVFSQTIDADGWFKFLQKHEKLDSQDSWFSALFHHNSYHHLVKELLFDLMIFEENAKKLSKNPLATELMQRLRLHFLSFEGIHSAQKLLVYLEKLKLFLDTLILDSEEFALVHSAIENMLPSIFSLD